MKIRIAKRVMSVPDFYSSAHNRGKLIEEDVYNDFQLAKDKYKEALAAIIEEYEVEQ